MSNYTGKTLHVSMSPTGLMFGFSWFGKDENGELKFGHKFIDDIPNEVLTDVRQRLNKLGVEWHIASIENDRLSMMCEFPPVLDTFFHAVVTSNDSVTALITPFELVLQPHEGVAHD